MSFKLTEIDPNFAIDSTFPDEIAWFNCQEPPIEIFGLAVCEGENFWRLPEDYHQINQGIQTLAKHTAGGRIRFRTDSPFVALAVKLLNTGLMVHMPLTGKSGCDIYLGAGGKSVYKMTALPVDNLTQSYGAVCFKKPEMEDVTVNLPLYNGIKAVYIGISPKAKIASPTPYSLTKPIVYYGSSITQGGCASRPGNAYPAILSRWLDADYLNLGFSGSAKGEPEMAEYIAQLEISVFVMDYDHNAKTKEELAATHQRFFQQIRKANPSLPVIMLSKPDFAKDPEDSAARREIIRNTYEQAKAEGDENVWFVDGELLFGSLMPDSCTVDGIHPNDLGFMRMAETVRPLLAEVIDRSRRK